VIDFKNTYVGLPERFYARAVPVGGRKPELIRVNEGLMVELGIELGADEALGVFSGNVVPEGAEPLAQAYAGHQFGGFVPSLGDGRAILMGEVLDRMGRRRDVQWKGAGRTAFSRGGDGSSALGPVLREYLVSEAMHALGVPTTRALAAVSTGDAVVRDEVVPGGIFTRVASSHIRIGTFQYFAAREDVEAVEILARYCMERHYPQVVGAGNTVLAFLEGVIEAQALLVARWLPLGFIHGVMNTDNCSISGETIDYGPCAFMDVFHPERVFSFIDRNGRYAWGNQPVICHWNLTRLAETLLPLLDDDPEVAKEMAKGALAKYIGIFQDAYFGNFRRKLGIGEESDEGGSFIKATLGLLARQEVDFTLFFLHLTLHAGGDERSILTELFKEKDVLETWLRQWEAMPKAEGYVEVMLRANPVVIPRNHKIEQVIQAAYRGDFAPFQRMAEAVVRPFEENEEYEMAPGVGEVVKNTFCGT
jgi:serine/tyrosine/threonine adenylyltransferase